MNKLCGAQGEIVNFPFKDVHDIFYNQNGIEIEIKEGNLYVGVDDEAKLDEAKELAHLHLFAWSLRQNIKVGVDFNHTWKTNAQGNQDNFLDLHDNVRVVDHLQIQTVTHQVSIKGSALIVTQEMHDSASPANDTSMVNKALKDKTLKNALRYFSEEVVDDDRPLYGIYKALEVIAHHLGGGRDGWRQLGVLAGQNEVFVTDVKQTTQLQRHAVTPAHRRLTDDECKERAKILIHAYANSLP
jgi:hypothetical protein